MKPIRSFVVTATLPPKLEKLKELANNYFWSWNSDSRELFVRMDRQLWEEVQHNPVQLLNKIPTYKLQQLAEQTDFINYVDWIYAKYDKYMKEDTWFSHAYPAEKGVIAYFSPEYGINESFPNYSGGLGVLSGDHMKSASDLGLPLVGIGLLYQQGYFRQILSNNGWQNETYNYNDFYTMPLTLIRDDKDEPIKIFVDMPIGRVFSYIWQLNVGRIRLLFLDTNIEENKSTQMKSITDALYGGDRETRIQQEVILGIGGMRAMDAIGINPEVVHINEGHAAFALLERTRMLMKKYNLDFKSARNLNNASAVFTTHTPVPAGNEAFDTGKIDAYLNQYYNEFGLSKETFCELGQFGKYNSNEAFSMTILGLGMTSYRNGVSKLHGVVSRDMWSKLWRNFPVDEVPISSITNGIHTSTWVAREFAELFDRYLSPHWRYLPDQADWSKVHLIPNEEIWREKQRRRVRLVLFAREYLKTRSKRLFPSDSKSTPNQVLNPDALTIGFARRFATYKRANLIFKNIPRLKEILTNPERPIQIIISGKAHPHDTQGKEVIQSIIHTVRQNGLDKNVIFLEDYDLVISRMMVKGCDVWLNNPIRPLEASGTSGMKAALNGTLNLSILDGWWDEAYNGNNGFAIGVGDQHENTEEIELVESEMIYDLLETVIAPTFYNRSATNVPDDWVKLMKNCIETNAPTFSTSRMVKEYAVRFYIPALNSYKELSENFGANAKALQQWKDKIIGEWSNVRINKIDVSNDATLDMNEQASVSAHISLGNVIKPEDIIVQVYYGTLDHNNEITSPATKEITMRKQEGDQYVYEGDFSFHESGVQGFTLRVLPTHNLLASNTDLYLATWAQP
ncbi:MAG: alpha-glucan family phosphorylase [Ignavibacteria bacterium]|jgi:starch phosphorylase|nr:alpha-glucan family phosphorylase [Ignavibacteria bacterium]